MYRSRYMPCSECGASVEQTASASHACDIERRLAYELFQLREEIARFEADVTAFLDSAPGRFEVWYARRERLGADGGEARAS